MKKKYLSVWALATLIVGSGAFTACKDYDDDINGLQKQIDGLSSNLKEMKDKIDSGVVLKSVEKIDGGIKITLGDGKTYELTNGKDGAVWSIDKDGYWTKDGVKFTSPDFPEGVKAKGEKGDKGDAGSNGSNGGTTKADEIYYAPNPETGKFDKYVNGKKVEATNISFYAPGTITAALEGDKLTLKGVKGAPGEVLVLPLLSDLTSLVFMPLDYEGGIENITYPYLAGFVKTHQANLSGKSRLMTADGKTQKSVTGLDDYFANDNDNVPGGKNGAEFAYGPAWTVPYHVNPSNVNTVYADIKGFNVLNPTVTRGGALKVTSPEKNAAGETLFSKANGVMNVGLQIENPALLKRIPAKLGERGDVYTIALQANTKKKESGFVTSDYAMVQPEKANILGLVWNKKPMYYALGAKNDRKGDETLKAYGKDKIFVYDSPQEALADKDGAALEVYFDDEKGINIQNYLGVAYQKEDSKADFKMVPGIWDVAGAKRWGLTFEYKLVEYKVDGNATVDSKYAKWVDEKNGVVRAWNVKHDEKPQGQTSESAIDREPLVQVVVKNNKGDVVLDGYILLHITKKQVTPEQKPNITVDKYPAFAATFDLCNAVAEQKTTWAQFNDFVLTQAMQNMTKKDFDAQYEPDFASATPASTTADGNPVFEMKQFAEAMAKGGADQAVKKVGQLLYYGNTEGTTNHVFGWTISESEAEALTRDQAKLPVQIVTYGRYKAKNDDAKYPYVYVKFTFNLDRVKLNENDRVFAEKNTNYWYGLDGSDAKSEAIVFNVYEPHDGKDIKAFNRDILFSLVGNKVNMKGDHKFYFVPKVTTVTAQNGKKYEITAASSASDATYNKLITKYAPEASKVYDEANFVDQLNKIAADYNKGMFNNVTLYAKEGATYTKIATLNNQTGEISLIHNAASHDVLNAVGYAQQHANIAKEFNTWVGVVAPNNCGVAVPVKDYKFVVSWQRPINMEELQAQTIVDGKTNGNVIYLNNMFKFFDFRGYAGSDAKRDYKSTESYMWDNHQWFWAYYGINQIDVDLTPNKVLTNMHQADKNKFVALNTITTKVKLLHNASKQNDKHSYTFDLSSYNSASKNADLLKYFEDNKDKFGAIYYENNGDNVEEFAVKVPVVVHYTWGEFNTTLTINIKRTLGN